MVQQFGKKMKRNILPQMVKNNVCLETPSTRLLWNINTLLILLKKTPHLLIFTFIRNIWYTEFYY
jgi:hypothetical protein